jgi:hypothetical protein
LTRLLPDAPLVRAAGRILGAEVEKSANPDDVDHVWIRLDIGGEITVAVNTLSKKNRMAGHDPRVRVGMVRGPREDPPKPGATACGRMDYGQIETRDNVFFEHYARAALELLLLDCCARALALEVWGAPHGGPREGIHQVHSRRSSCAVPEDIAGRDGALKFYFAGATLLLLFKFCGQK